MKRHSAVAIFAATLGLLTIAPTASATDYWAVTSGGSGFAPCNEGTPCTLDLALTLAGGSPGHTVHLKAGPNPYETFNGLALTQPNMTIVGEGATKPVIRATGTNAAAIPSFGLSVSPTAGGVSIRNIRVESTSGAQAIQSYGPNARISDVEVNTALPTIWGASVAVGGYGTSVDRLVTSGVTTVGLHEYPFGTPDTIALRRSRLSSATTALSMGPRALVTDTLARAEGPGVVAISTLGGKLSNVTGISSGANSKALHAVQGFGPNPTGPTVKNSVFRADGAGASDVTSDPGLPPGSPSDPICGIDPTNPMCVGTHGGNLTITRSNFRAASGTLNPASGANSSADPQFGDGYRPLAGSPLIDAGVDDADNGTVDLDGKARKIAGAVDIGAFEFQPPAQAQPQTPSGGGEQQPVIQPIVDSTAPALSKLGITNKTFAVGSAATAVAARARKGTTFVYTLSEAAAVVLTVERPTTGRRSGRSCVKQTRRNRKANKCTRYVRGGAINGGTGTAGANALPFSGRIGKKALKPGKYRAALVAVDAAGNKSAAKTVAFKVVKR